MSAGMLILTILAALLASLVLIVIGYSIIRHFGKHEIEPINDGNNNAVIEISRAPSMTDIAKVEDALGGMPPGEQEVHEESFEQAVETNRPFKGSSIASADPRLDT